MSDKKRKENEKKFKDWTDTDSGGRTYVKEIKSKSGWKAEYIKIVDNKENTLEFIMKTVC